METYLGILAPEKLSVCTSLARPCNAPLCTDTTATKYSQSPVHRRQSRNHASLSCLTVTR